MGVRTGDFLSLSEDVLDYAAEMEDARRDGVGVLLGWWTRANPATPVPDTFEAFRLRPDGLWQSLASLGEHVFCEAELLNGGGAARCNDVVLVFLTVRDEKAEWESSVVRLDGTRWFDAGVGRSAWRSWASDALRRMAPDPDGVPYPAGPGLLP